MISPVSGFKLENTRYIRMYRQAVQRRALRAQFAANGNCAGFVDRSPVLIADDLDFLRIIVDGLVHDHEVSLRSALSSKIGAVFVEMLIMPLCDLFIERFFSQFPPAKVVLQPPPICSGIS